MAARSLSADDIAFGRAVLLATDSLGMSAEGAFWLHDTHEKKWRYFLITSLFNTLGSREIYLRLNRSLAKKLSERETKQFQVFMGAPNESLVRAIAAAVRTDIHASDPQRVSVALDCEKTRAVVYRLAPAAEEKEVRRAKRRFLATSKELLAA